ncbi:MAG: molybdopterin molybdotransferase MoeA [Cellvibrionaceae bacterium]|nr:molybdopterin molybdotransferase MoeA [Cellvibrionaceae bacterium]
MMDVFTARAMIAGKAQALPQESVPLAQALGRILAADITARIDVPPAANSAMDGYALQIPDTAAPWRLPVSQVIAAGRAPSPLQLGTAARIFTGGEIPAGANAVAIQEECERDGDQVIVLIAPAVGENIRPRGQDLQAGQLVATTGTRLTALHLGLLASCGVDAVEVRRRPRVALLSSGSELVEPGRPLQPGQIYNSNLHLLRGLLQDWGCELVQETCVADDLEQTRAILKASAERADLIISTGGVSVGDADHLKAAISSLGELDLWKVNMKPGKPLAFGRLGTTPILALPGNPVSAFTTAILFVKPFIEGLYGRPYQELPFQNLPAGFAIHQPRRRPEFMRVRAENGRLQPFANQSSGVLSSLLWADGLAWIAADSTLAEGNPVPYLPMQTLLTL